jgi:hypothetical protein
VDSLHPKSKSCTTTSSLHTPGPVIETRATQAERDQEKKKTLSSRYLPSPFSLIPISIPTHRDEATLGIFAATFTFGHTLVLFQHITRLTDAALSTGGGDFDYGTLTAAIQVPAGR